MNQTIELWTWDSAAIGVSTRAWIPPLRSVARLKATVELWNQARPAPALWEPWRKAAPPTRAVLSLRTQLWNATWGVPPSASVAMEWT